MHQDSSIHLVVTTRCWYGKRGARLLTHWSSCGGACVVCMGRRVLVVVVGSISIFAIFSKLKRFSTTWLEIDEQQELKTCRTSSTYSGIMSWWNNFHLFSLLQSSSRRPSVLSARISAERVVTSPSSSRSPWPFCFS